MTHTPVRPRQSQRKLHRVILTTLVVLLALITAACSNFEPSAAAASNGTSQVDDVVLAGPTPEPTATPEPELPPETAQAGEPIPQDIGTTTAFGLAEVCSLYEPERLSELLGGFWTLEPGVEGSDKCLWLSDGAAESSALVSIELAPTTDPDNPGSLVMSDQGDGLRITADGNALVINVVSDDVDPTFSALNAEEAERRIADDIYLRLTGQERPTASIES